MSVYGGVGYGPQIEGLKAGAQLVLARELELDQHVRLGRGEHASDGRRKPSILADVFEAVLGALYLDGGIAAANHFVEREFRDRLRDPDVLRSDPKTRLQEWVQERGEPTPTYRTVGQRGPDQQHQK